MLQIDGKKIGPSFPPYVIAEGGLNHNGDVKIAKKMIEEAAKSGADAIKFQTYKTEEFLRKSSQYFDVFKKVELSFEEFGELKDYSKNQGITFFSTPFDIVSAEFLKKINVPCFKIASSDLTNIPLIRHVAKSSKPVIISTGLAIMDEVREAVTCCLHEGNDNIALLHCVANYPTLPEETNLEAIRTMKDAFSFSIGYSDNGESTLVDLVAASIGAEIIEKHFTLDKKMSGPDHSFSIDPDGLKTLVSQLKTISKMKGNGIKTPRESELKMRSAIRKSLTAKKRIRQGETITSELISVKRPAEGIEPKYFQQIIGKKATKDIEEDSAIKWYDIS